MPRRTDLKRVLIIGSGPIVIGQACEFDYSGSQACKALRAEGLEVILVNSNPATIMTDPELADRTYVEPLTPEVLAAIIERERPDALLPTVGGQTALNLAMDLAARRHARQVQRRADRRVDRRRSRSPKIGSCSRTRCARSASTCRRAASRASLRRGDRAREDARLPARHPPVVHARRRRRRHRLQHRRVPRAGRARHRAQPGARDPRRGVGHRLEGIRARGDARRRRQLRRHLLDREHRSDGRAHRRQHHRRADPDADATRNTSGCATPRAASSAASASRPADRTSSSPSIPTNGRMVVIEMNPRVSRSSALASKATGFPIAKIAAKLALGYHLDEIPNDITRLTPASFEPTIDYVVVKIPALELREVPAGGSHADDADEVGGRGDGDRPDVQGSVHEGRALARARAQRPAVRARRSMDDEDDARAAQAAGDCRPTGGCGICSARSAAAGPSSSCTS